jgi:hypothetical protein
VDGTRGFRPAPDFDLAWAIAVKRDALEASDDVEKKLSQRVGAE